METAQSEPDCAVSNFYWAYIVCLPADRKPLLLKLNNLFISINSWILGNTYLYEDSHNTIPDLKQKQYLSSDTMKQASFLESAHNQFEMTFSNFSGGVLIFCQLTGIIQWMNSYLGEKLNTSCHTIQDFFEKSFSSEERALIMDTLHLFRKRNEETVNGIYQITDHTGCRQWVFCSFSHYVIS